MAQKDKIIPYPTASINSEFKKFYDGPAKAVTGFPIKAAFPAETVVDPKKEKATPAEEVKAEAAPAAAKKTADESAIKSAPAAVKMEALAPSAAKEQAAAKERATPAPPVESNDIPKATPAKDGAPAAEKEAAPAKEAVPAKDAAPAFAQKLGVSKDIAKNNKEWETFVNGKAKLLGIPIKASFTPKSDAATPTEDAASAAGEKAGPAKETAPAFAQKSAVPMSIVKDNKEWERFVSKSAPNLGIPVRASFTPREKPVPAYGSKVEEKKDVEKDVKEKKADDTAAKKAEPAKDAIASAKDAEPAKDAAASAKDAAPA